MKRKSEIFFRSRRLQLNPILKCSVDSIPRRLSDRLWIERLRYTRSNFLISRCRWAKASATIWISFSSPVDPGCTSGMENKLQKSWTISQLPSVDLDGGFSILALLILRPDKSSLLGREDGPVHCRVFSNVPGLYPQADSSTFTLVTTKNISRYCHMSLGEGEQTWLLLRNTELDMSVSGVFEMSGQRQAFRLSNSLKL